MDHIHYEDIAVFEEDTLDCLSIDEMLLEMLTEEYEL
jgi:hypothetical protein